MSILEADGPASFTGTAREHYSRRKPRHATRFAVLRAPTAPASDKAATDDLQTQQVLRHGSISGRRALPSRRLKAAFLWLFAALGAALLLGVAAWVGMRSAFTARDNAAKAVTRITVIEGETTRLVFTQAKTVGEVMRLLGIRPDEDDYINLSAD